MSVAVESHHADLSVSAHATLRVFVSSPQDVALERAAIARAAAAVNDRFGARATVELVLWEENSYHALSDFQSQIDDPACCDALIAILWGRYGSPLQDSLREEGPRPRYRSGTSFEIDAALEARGQDVYLFRKSQDIFATIRDKRSVEEALDQYANLQAYLDGLTRTEQGASKRAINMFATTEEFEERARRLLETLVERKLAGARRTVWDPRGDGSPFPGLNAYDVSDGALFFGRGRKTELAVESLLKAQARRRGFLLVVGPSGSGKSSLMRAGIAPRLLAGGPDSRTDAWRVAVMRPRDGASPFLSLAQALLSEAAPADRTGRELSVEGPAAPVALPELRTLGLADAEALALNWAALGREVAVSAQVAARQGRSLFDLLDGKLPAAAAAIGPLARALDVAGAELGRARGYQRPAEVRLLLLIDQMEELFSDAAHAGVPPQNDETAQEAFAAILTAMVASGRIAIVATFRADLYARLLSSRPLLALVDAGASYALAPPGPNELQEIVTRSAEACGLTFERDAETGERLDERLLLDAQGPNSLPLLQYALDKLYLKRVLLEEGATLTFAAYREIGGLAGAIDAAASTALDEVRARLGPKVDRVVAPLIRSLIAWVPAENGASEDQGTIVARQVRLDRANADAALCAVVDALAAARVLVASADAGDANVATIRIAHERVLDAWSLAADVKRRSQAAIRDRDRLMAQFLEWSQNGRKDDRLIQSGAKLREALEHRAEFGDEVGPELAGYIDRSRDADLKARRRERTMALALRAAAVVALAFGVGMAVVGWKAVESSKLASKNYTLARDVVGRLIREFSSGLSDVQGLSVRTVDRVLGSVAPMVESLSGSSGDDPELIRISGGMHYQFANLYRTIDITKAQRESDRSFALREMQFAQDRGQRREIAEEMAEAWEIRGDIERKQPAIGKAEDIAARSRKAYESSLAVRQSLFDRNNGDPQSRFGLSLILIRLGDLAVGDEALRRYRQALDVVEPALAAVPGDRKVLREASWAAAKIGDVALARARRGATIEPDPDMAEAFTYYVRALCNRHALVAIDDNSVLARQDIAYALRRLGNLEEKRENEAGAFAARFEELRERRQLAEANRGNPQLWRELATNLHEVAETLRRFRPGETGLHLRYLREATTAFDRPVSLEAPISGDARAFRAKLELSADAFAAAGVDSARIDSDFALLERQYAVLRPTLSLCAPR